jgi:hypothetical protein
MASPNQRRRVVHADHAAHLHAPPVRRARPRHLRQTLCFSSRNMQHASEFSTAQHTHSTPVTSHRMLTSTSTARPPRNQPLHRHAPHPLLRQHLGRPRRPRPSQQRRKLPRPHLLQLHRAYRRLDPARFRVQPRSPERLGAVPTLLLLRLQGFA